MIRFAAAGNPVSLAKLPIVHKRNSSVIGQLFHSAPNGAPNRRGDLNIQGEKSPSSAACAPLRMMRLSPPNEAG